MFRFLSTTSKRLKFKSTMTIPKSQCLQEQTKYVTNIDDYEKAEKSHAWCEKFCTEFCMRCAIDDCNKINDSFCEQNCKDECFFVGPTPVRKCDF